ncbi:HD domain-containing protein, partial [Patescibacteria group bacterium]
MIEASSINIEKLRGGQFQDELPEFFELKNCIEDDGWHNKESVFAHTMSVLEELEKLLRIVNDKINSYLNQKVDAHSRRDLLFLGTLFHDIAKNDTIIKEHNITLCPKHEEVGSEKVKNILDRFDLSEQEKVIVVNIVKYHGEIHSILRTQNDEIDEQFDDFNSRHHDIFIELILLGMSDTFGSQLKDN